LYVKANVNAFELVAVTNKDLEPRMSGRSCMALSY